MGPAYAAWVGDARRGFDHVPRATPYPPLMAVANAGVQVVVRMVNLRSVFTGQLRGEILTFLQVW